MRYAKVVLGLPVEGPFDYIVPQKLADKINVGSRVSVSFGRQKKVGYIVKFSPKTDIKDLKPVIEVLDEKPILDKNMLLLTKKLSEYYCCSWGEAIETALPRTLRRGKIIPLKEPPNSIVKEAMPRVILAHCLDVQKKWNAVYLGKIKDTLDDNKSIIILLPDMTAVLRAEKIIKMRFDCPTVVLYRNEPDELRKWVDIKKGKVNIVIGTRSSIFAPLNNLGLIIVDEEEAYGHKQDQAPHYNAREVAFMRSLIDKAAFILGSRTPSPESIELSRKKKIEYIFIPGNENFPEIKIIDMKGLPLVSRRKNIIISKYLQDSIIQNLNSKGKILLFLNRLGFATIVSCVSCGAILKCRRCNINLVFHYKENTLSCHYCNFKIEPPKICPDCNSGYVRYSGAGTEKMESELSRLFPQARVKQLGKKDNIRMADAEIFISTQSIIKEQELNFDLIGVLSIDSSLNRIDFRAGEKTFNILMGLAGITNKKIIIQTNFPQHHAFKALSGKNIDSFYDEELKQRKELNFPPYSHLALIKLRGKNEDKVESASKLLFGKLSKYKHKTVEFVSVNPSYPSKLRGNFYWQILVKSHSPFKICKFLKTHLHNFPHSGIIVTVDIDPI